MRTKTASRLLIVVLLSLGSAATLFAQPATPRRVPVELTGDALYQSLGSFDPAERKAMIASLPIIEREQLWTIHLKAFLREHPELASDQRAVIYEGLGLIAAGGMTDALSDDPAIAKSAMETIRQLRLRATSVLPPELAGAAFVHLGRAWIPPIYAIGSGRRPSKIAKDWGCTCSVNFYAGECFVWGGCIMDLDCTVQHGCGYLQLEACDGLCSG